MSKITPIVEKHYKLILWTLPKLANFPKDQRFLLADRITNSLLDILRALIKAVYSKEKLEILKSANLEIEQLRFLVRLAKDMRHLNLKAYDYFCLNLLEIGRMLGGWIKFSEIPRSPGV